MNNNASSTTGRDRVVDRTKSIGAGKRGAAPKQAQLAKTDQESGAGLSARSMIGDLVDRHERIAQRLRGDIERLRDPATADLLRSLLEFHETTAWMLRIVSNSSDSGSAAV